MNILLGVAVLFVCVYLGYECSIKYVNRKNYYVEFENFNTALINEVAFSQSTITKLIDKNLDKKDDFSKNIIAFIKQNQKKISSAILSNEEKDELEVYFNNIGLSDRDTQLKFLEGYKTKLKDRVEQSKMEEKKYKSFYLKMGFLFGLIALIILL